MAAINKANFFAKLGKLHREKVTLKAFGDVYVKALTIKEQEEFETLAMDDTGSMKTDISIKSLMVVKSVEDEQGNKLFTMDDMDQLSTMPSAPINKLFSVSSRLNNITEKDIEELKGN